MDKKLNFTKEELLNHKFGNSPYGYTPLEVDQFFDKVIEDYETLLSSYGGLNGGEEVEKLAHEILELKKENENLRKELENEKNKWKYMPKDHRDIHLDNYELLQRIGKLEMIIYEKLHMNPDEIK